MFSFFPKALQHLNELLEGWLFLFLLTLKEEGVHVLQDNEVETIFGLVPIVAQVGVVVLMKGSGESEKQIVQSAMTVMDMRAMMRYPGMALPQQSLGRLLSIIGRVGIIEYDGSPALPPEVEAYLGEVMLVPLRILIGVVVLVVAVVEALGIEKRGLVITRARQHDKYNPTCTRLECFSNYEEIEF